MLPSVSSLLQACNPQCNRDLLCMVSCLGLKGSVKPNDWSHPTLVGLPAVWQGCSQALRSDMCDEADGRDAVSSLGSAMPCSNGLVICWTLMPHQLARAFVN